MTIHFEVQTATTGINCGGFSLLIFQPILKSNLQKRLTRCLHGRSCHSPFICNWNVGLIAELQKPVKYWYCVCFHGKIRSLQFLKADFWGAEDDGILGVQCAVKLATWQSVSLTFPYYLEITNKFITTTLFVRAIKTTHCFLISDQPSWWFR